LCAAQKDYYDVETAKSSIKKNEIWAVLRFGWNYTDSLRDRVLTGRDSAEDVVDHSFLEFWVDDSGDFDPDLAVETPVRVVNRYAVRVSDRYMSILIERDVSLSLADALKNLVGSCDGSLDKVITYPIKVRTAAVHAGGIERTRDRDFVFSEGRYLRGKKRKRRTGLTWAQKE